MYLPLTNLTTLATVVLPTVAPLNPSDPRAPYPATIFSREANSTTNLTISVNGQCSGGQTCLGSQFGESCSQYGYCGPTNDTEYSGAGCMPQFGVCGSNATASTSHSDGRASAFETAATLVLTQSHSQASLSSVAAEMTTSVRSSSAVASSVASSSAFSPQYTYSPTSTFTASTTTPTSTSTASTASTAPTSASSSSNATAPSNQYTQFLGTGSPSEGWPSQSAWKDFDTLFEMNRQIMRDSCIQWNVPNDSDFEIDVIKHAILNVANSSGVDERFILVIMLQESNGCVRAPVTSLSVSNPGLLQSYMGTAKCNSGSATAPADVQTPCPSFTILHMIEEGTTGTVPGGMSLTYALQKSGASDVSKYYKAARIYNSGSIASSGLLQDGVATHCYASDVANRLLGWSLGPSGCTLNSS